MLIAIYHAKPYHCPYADTIEQFIKNDILDSDCISLSGRLGVSRTGNGYHIW